MLDLKETWENLLMWLLCLCTFLLLEIFSLYGLWVAIHCFENKIVVKLHAFLWKKCLTGWSCCIVINICFFHEGLYLFCHCTIQKTQVKKVKWCLSGELLWSSQKKSGLYGMTNTQLVWRKIYFFCLVTSMGQKEKILRPHEELNIRPLDSWVTKK